MKKNVSDICQTPVCLDAASRLSHDMDPSVNPCDDFYEFTCGGFLNSTDLKIDSQRIDKFTELKSKFLKTITTILEEDNSINKNNKYLKLVKTLYKTCNNKKDSIWDFLGSIDNWPVLGSQWNESEFDFDKLILKIGNTTQWNNYFFEFSSVGDGYPIVVDPYPSDLSWEDFGGSHQASTKINEYYNNIIKKVQLIGVPAYNPNYTDDFKKIFDIEIELGRVRLSEEQKLHSTFDTIEMTLNELTSDFSFFNWQQYINYLRGYPVDLSTIIVILISYMMLQDDFFDSEKPNFMNYGALGSMIGHEITHGFDFNGMNFDGEGHWSNSQWTELSKNNFYNKSKCIIEQYNNFAVPEVGLNVNGGISQDENIADNGGIKAAYRAYKKLLNSDKKLPGLEFSPQQLFWINYANVFCEKNSNEYLRNYLDGVHPPSKFRIIGTLSNSPEFAKDFNCPSGSNMNPIKKCFIW
ncbi:endothelin-converting enzyme homolog [Aphidius gifuensis]|uniref:endothelin-converting enzyme homolog n=1 Tax=Aphidius gifuensis TaxID=684658 RepID=UPI001CDCD914|nr:endothelin-converting enzyme homolog [Aphidius gifuensis]